MAGGVLFGREAWNPWQISGQIIAVQALYYLSLGVLYKLVVGEFAGAGPGWRQCCCFLPPTAAASPSNHPPGMPLPAGPYVPGLSLHDMFDWRRASFRSFQGWMVTLATVANALLAAFVLRYIVRNSWLLSRSQFEGCACCFLRCHVCCPAFLLPLRSGSAALCTALLAPHLPLPCPPRLLPTYTPNPSWPQQVRRAKKCLDFAGTILLLHLAAVACISGFPRSAAW